MVSISLFEELELLILVPGTSVKKIGGVFWHRLREGKTLFDSFYRSATTEETGGKGEEIWRYYNTNAYICIHLVSGYLKEDDLEAKCNMYT